MRLVIKLLGVLLVLAGVAAAGTMWWLDAPLKLRSPKVEVSIEHGTSARGVARAWVQAGVDAPERLLYEWFRWSGQSRNIRAGSYEIESGASPRSLLDKMVRGDETLETVRFIEGWTLRQVREALAKAPHLRASTAEMDDAQLATALGLEAKSAEGWLFPDTYAYSRGVSDLTVMKRAVGAMKDRVEAAWASREPDTPLKSAADMLVLASVVEKETGSAADRGLIAGVFLNRLKVGMPLQSDPTVIYGMGSAFDGNLRRVDLRRDTPWNTYTRPGLPPTPISMPGTASLQAVVKPDATTALYFVSRGDGSSHFSDSLSEHNRAVNEYQRKPAR